MQNARERFQESLEKKKRDLVHQDRTQLRVLAQAEVPASALTKSPEWNYYLSLVEAKVEELEESLNTLQRALATDMIFDHAGLATNKAFAMRLKVQIDTLQAVLDLPRQIIEMGERAKLVLVQYDEQ